MKTLAIAAAALFLTVASATAGELGACGDGRGVQSIIASSANGVAVGAGLERGIVVYLHGLSKADSKTIDMPYGAGLLVEPGGSRFALLEGKTVHLYSFGGFRRLAKASVSALKNQSIVASSWVEGSEEVTLFSSQVKQSVFGIGDSKKTPYLLHINLQTGSGRQAPLQISSDYLSAAFDGKGERLAVAFQDGRVEVRGTSDGSLLASYKGHSSPWNSLGLAFHPSENLLASSDGGKLILFDLDRKEIRSTHPVQDGARLLQYVADGRFFIAGDTTNLSLLDPKGKRLETKGSEEGYEDFFVADGLRKVFSVGGGLVCWRTFDRWERVPVVTRASDGSPPAPADVTYKGIALSWYIAELRGQDAKRRLDALYAIEQIGSPGAAAVPDLIQALGSPEWTVRAAAARALGAIGPAAKDAAAKLESLRKDTEQSVREAATAALEKIARKAS